MFILGIWREFGGVASFLVNYFSGDHFQALVAVHPCSVVL